MNSNIEEIVIGTDVIDTNEISDNEKPYYYLYDFEKREIERKKNHSSESCKFIGYRPGLTDRNGARAITSYVIVDSIDGYTLFYEHSTK